MSSANRPYLYFNWITLFFPARDVATPEDYAVFQKTIQSWGRLDGKPHTGPDDHADRLNGTEVYSWDQNANHGKGGWLHTGQLAPSPNHRDGDPWDPDEDVLWFADEDIEKEYGADFYEPLV